MQITNIGIILCVLTFLIVVSMVLFHYFLVSKNKRIYLIFHSYYYWLVWGIVFLVYFILARWVIKINDWINTLSLNLDLSKPNDIYIHSTSYSNAFLLDLCPAVAFLLPLTLIIDKTRTIAKCIAPYAIIGSVITIYSTTLTYSPIGNVWEYIFLGDAPNEMFFMMHFNSLVLAIGVMLTTKQYTKYSVFGSMAFIAMYISYVAIFVNHKSVLYNTTGLSNFDWKDDVYFNFSEYGLVYNFFPIGFPWIQIVSYSIAVGFQFLFQFIKNVTTTDVNKITDLNNMWYSKIKIIAPYLSKLDKWYEFNLNNSKS